MLKLLQKIAGSPESGLLASSFNTADGYENQLSATAEMINTSSAKGTAALTLKVKPSRFSCVIISTEASEGIGIFIAFTPLSESGSTVTRSWAVAVLRGQNDRPYRLLSPFGNSRQEFVTGNVSVCQTESQESLGFERGSQVGPRLRTGDFTRIWEYSYVTKKMPEQNNRPGIRRYSLIKNNSAAAPITTKETEPSKLTTKSALTDNSLNTVMSSSSRVISSVFTTCLLTHQGSFQYGRVRVGPCVFRPEEELGACPFRSSALISQSISEDSEVRVLNHTARFGELLKIEKMPEQNNRPGIERYSLIKNNSAAAPITAKETEPSKLTTKSALTDNSLNTIRSSNSRSVFSFTTNLLVQGLGAWPRRIEPCVFLPLRNLEDFVSKGPSASPPGSIFIRKTKAFNPTRFFTENNNPPSTKKVSVSAMI